MKRRIAPFEIPTSLLSLLLLAHLVSPVPLRAATEDPIPSLTRSADFIFRGTVQEVGASNVSFLETEAADPKTAWNTAIVQVEKLFKASGPLADFGGWEITVVGSEPLIAGESRVFFTTVRSLGESLGVAEVGRVEGSVAELGARVLEAQDGEQRNHLATRLAAAELAVSGRIVSTAETTETHSSRGAAAISKHDPQWREAVLAVRHVLKGQVTEKRVSFLYPESLDPAWAEVPKPKVGEVGTWLLHRSADLHDTDLVVRDRGDRLSETEAEWAETLTVETNP